MKLMRRNTRKIYYALCKGRGPVTYDENGYETGEGNVEYGEPQKLTCNVGAEGTGEAWVNVFGISDNYDRVILTDMTDCPIQSDTVLWVDRKPAKDGSVPYDYTVWRVSNYLNQTAYAVKKVTTNA